MNPDDDPQDNPGDNPEEIPGNNPEEQLDEKMIQQQLPVIPEKVSLTINHVLDRGDGSERLTHTEIIEGLDLGTTIIGSDYQVQENGIIFVGSQPEQLILGACESNFITLEYVLDLPAVGEQDEIEEVILNNPDNLSQFSTGIIPAKPFYSLSSWRMMGAIYLAVMVCSPVRFS